MAEDSERFWDERYRKGEAPLFAVVAVGLVVVLAVGHRFLGLARPMGDGGQGEGDE